MLKEAAALKRFEAKELKAQTDIAKKLSKKLDDTDEFGKIIKKENIVNKI